MESHQDLLSSKQTTIKTYLIAKLLNDPCKFSRSQIGIEIISRSRTNQFARSENERCTPRLSYSHHNTMEPRRIIFRVSCPEIDVLQIQIAAQVNGGHTILDFDRVDSLLRLRHRTLRHNAALWRQLRACWSRCQWSRMLFSVKNRKFKTMLFRQMLTITLLLACQHMNMWVMIE